jgi:FkbH-like protein
LLDVVQSPFDQVAQESILPDSDIHRSNPNAVLFALDYRALCLKASWNDDQSASARVGEALSYLDALRDGVARGSSAVCIFQTFAPPVETLFGNLDRILPGSIRSLIESINQGLAGYVRSSRDVLLDVAGLAESVGLAEWHDAKQWSMARFSFSDQFVPVYADYVARMLAALCGKSRKVLVLDLDDVVWGGLIGDDGLDGIRIAPGDALGEAHLAVQRFALELRERGVILAVVSKNNDELARAPFEKHPDMLLKLDHFASFQANWNDKATNIQIIADELSVNPEAIVFLDDSPVERELVRKLLPDVAVPELSGDPAYFYRTIAAAGYFEAVAVSNEDLKRAQFYQRRGEYAHIRKQYGDLDGYLSSLDMSISFERFNSLGRARIGQLINRSNQYNLTTHRYTAPELITIEEDSNVFTLQARLTDKFGDNGVISAVICRLGLASVWDIDTWVMSCRVLGRKVEYVVLGEILRHARAVGIEKLSGVYCPTGRNKLVADHYAKLGFSLVCEDKSGVTKWEMLTQATEPQGIPIKVASSDLALKGVIP